MRGTATEQSCLQGGTCCLLEELHPSHITRTLLRFLELLNFLVSSTESPLSSSPPENSSGTLSAEHAFLLGKVEGSGPTPTLLGCTVRKRQIEGRGELERIFSQTQTSTKFNISHDNHSQLSPNLFFCGFKIQVHNFRCKASSLLSRINVKFKFL